MGCVSSFQSGVQGAPGFPAKRVIIHFQFNSTHDYFGNGFQTLSVIKHPKTTFLSDLEGNLISWGSAGP